MGMMVLMLVMRLVMSRVMSPEDANILYRWIHDMMMPMMYVMGMM